MPVCSGNHMDWTSLGDLFKVAVIVNIVLQGNQTMLYLKSSLNGDAGRLLGLIQISDHNFDAAFKILVNR